MDFDKYHSNMENPVPYKFNKEKDTLYWFFVEDHSIRSYDNDWNDSWNDSSFSNDSEFIALDSYLREHYPDVSFLDYKMLSQNIQKNYYTEHDYYDKTSYEVRSITIKDIEEMLGKPKE